MSYKKLGDIVKFISNKNVDGIATILYGINIDKYFMPSVANTIGVDLKKYKVVVKNQFACNRMHVGRDKRLPISMSTFDYPFIVSPAYDVFEVTDENVIPEYLMLLFRRSEFDRQCWFYTDADVRGGLSIDALKSIEIRIPSIEKQREIVAQYQAVENKIKVNEQICEKLEATAQTLYKQWFVDFEYPNEEGKPYKSSGGTMVYNQELEKEIPEGWEVKKLEDIYKIQIGRTPPRDEPKWFNNSEDENINWISIKDINENGNYILSTNESLSLEAYKTFKIPLIPKDTVVLSFKMSVGKLSITNINSLSNEAIASFIENENNYLSNKYLYLYLKCFNYKSLGTTSSIVNSINSSMIKEFKIIIPIKEVNNNFSNYIEDIYSNIKIGEIQNQKLTQLQSLLLSRLATLEG